MPKTISFIHCADIHFDTAFSGLSSVKAAIRRDELRRTFSKIVELCQEKTVDCLLIAGDLFDSTRVTDETIAFITHTLGQVPHLPVFIAPGNHDPYMPGTRYDSTSWPSNVTIFKEQTFAKYSMTAQDGSSVNIHGAAFTTPYLEKNLLETFSLKQEERADFDIMTLHGDMIGSGQNSVYHPISLSSIAQSKLDYLALGHKHTASQPERCGDTYVAYSGTPEGRGFDESGEKGVWYITLTKDDEGNNISLQSQWISCACRTYETLPVDITDCISHQGVTECIKAAITNPENLYKITLTGTLKNGFLLDLNLLQAALNDCCFFMKLRDTTHTEVDIEELAKENMLRGIFTRRLLAKIEEAKKKGNTKEEQLYTQALTLGLRAFEGEVSVYDHQINQN